MSNQDSLREVRQGHREPAVTHPAKLPHRLSAQICGQCHSVSIFQTTDQLADWLTHGFSYRPGDDLTQSRFLLRHDQNRESPQLRKYERVIPRFVSNTFWPDGMVKVTGREYSGIRESGCYQRGQLSCLSCHRLHQDANDSRPLQLWANGQLKPGMETNQACLQCHATFEKELESHTRHRRNSSGSQCYNCHMSHTAYGLLKAIRSHHISSPSVASSVQTGRPNACNQCHLDKNSPVGGSASGSMVEHGPARPDRRKKNSCRCHSLASARRRQPTSTNGLDTGMETRSRRFGIGMDGSLFGSTLRGSL